MSGQTDVAREKEKEGRKEKRSPRKKKRENDKEKNLLFPTNLHLKVLGMLKSFIQVGKLRHKETWSRELMHSSPIVMAAGPGRDTVGDEIQAGGRMTGPISGGLGAAAFADPWLKRSAPSRL